MSVQGDSGADLPPIPGLDRVGDESATGRPEQPEDAQSRRKKPTALMVGVAILIVGIVANQLTNQPEDGADTTTTSVTNIEVDPLSESDGINATPGDNASPGYASCTEYQGITCDGWVTDPVQVLTSEPSVEAAAAQLVSDYGHEIAVVIVADTGTIDPRTFAVELRNTWGVGDSDRDDGIVVVVALAQRRIEIVTGSGLRIDRLDEVAATGNWAFADGDFDRGLQAIIKSLGFRLNSS